MTKKTLMTLSIAGATALAVFSVTAPAQATSPQEYTCGEFLKVPEHSKANAVYWIEGFNKGAKPDSVDVTVENFKRPIGKVILECRKNKTETLWDAIVKHFYSAAKQIP